ncbi:MAG: peptide chain release factor N(5)-glutamine methyltransferase [Actinobacteria bacterium]|nr:peptide chain release factor N(5)-glutamine methyltransferase [Actinomycetota bacterium]
MSDEAAEGTISWRELLDEATARLRRVGFDTAEHDARRIVEEASGFEGARLMISLGELVTERSMARYDDMIARREASEPLQYVLGRWGFRTLDLAVDRRVLIPRPETEMVVEVALGEIDRIAAGRTDPRAPVVVADLGTGSGAIALSVASERIHTVVWACDASADAVAAARANLAGIGRAAARVTIVEGSWFDAFDAVAASGESLRGAFDVVITNPPYVPTTDELPASVRDWEPASALFAGEDGLDDLRVIIAAAPGWLRSAGALVMELDPRQIDAASQLLRAAGFAEVEVHRDLVGRDRILLGRLAADA